MAGGRGKTKYNAETTPEQARKLAMLGLTQAEMAKFFEVGTRTFEEWVARYPELYAAVKEGGAIADAEVAASLFKRAIGYRWVEQQAFKVKIDRDREQVEVVDVEKAVPPDTMACMYWLNNRQRSRWTRNPDPSGGDDDLPPTKVIFEVRDARSPIRQSDPKSPAG